MKFYAIIFGFLCIAGLIIAGVLSLTGSGSFKRLITISGIYSICKPDGYPVVCFLDSDGKDGGMFCLPLSTIGGNCTPKK